MLHPVLIDLDAHVCLKNKSVIFSSARCFIYKLSMCFLSDAVRRIYYHQMDHAAVVYVVAHIASICVCLLVKSSNKSAASVTKL